MSQGERLAATGGEPTAPRPARRSVLRGAAGVGAAGLAAGFVAGRSVAPAAGRAATAPRAATASRATTARQDRAAAQAATPAYDEPMVAHVRDAQAGIVDLYIGTRHVRFTDRQLAARLARAAGA